MAFSPLCGMNATLQDFYHVLRYLKKGSPLACGMLLALEDLRDPIEFLVKENYGDSGFDGSHYWPPSGSQPARIHWWIYDWTDLGGERYMNPAMALMHEIGHAFQHYKRNYPMTRLNWRKVEEDNIQKYEKPVAIQLGQPYREMYVNRSMGHRELLYKQWGKGPMKPVV